MTGFVRGKMSIDEGGEDCALEDLRDRGVNHDVESDDKSSRALGYGGGA